MPKIENEGTFQVKITQVMFREDPKDDDPGAFQLALKGETADGLDAWGHMYFRHKMITGGRNAGKTLAEANYDVLRQLGVKDGYPANIQKAIEDGLYAEFVMQNDEYDGKIALRVSFINPVREDVNVADVDWDKVMAKFDGEVDQAKVIDAPNITPPTDTPKASEPPKDGEIPF